MFSIATRLGGGSVEHLHPTEAAADEDEVDHRWREEAVRDHARLLVELAGEPAGIVDRPVVVGDRAAVRAGRGVGARSRRPDRCHRRHGRERKQLERQRRPQPVDQLVGGSDDDEATGGGSDDLFAGVGSAAALDQPAVGVDLVGAVDRQVETGDRIEGDQR